MPNEMKELLKIFPNAHSDTEKEIQSLVYIWVRHASQHRMSPGWVLIENHAVLSDDEKRWGITFVEQKCKLLLSQVVSERLSSCKWGIDVESRSGRISRLVG